MYYPRNLTERKRVFRFSLRLNVIFFETRFGRAPRIRSRRRTTRKTAVACEGGGRADRRNCFIVKTVHDLSGLPAFFILRERGLSRNFETCGGNRALNIGAKKNFKNLRWDLCVFHGNATKRLTNRKDMLDSERSGAAFIVGNKPFFII